MSQRCVGYEDQGPGRPRKPLYEPLGPASAGSGDGLAALGRLSALDLAPIGDRLTGGAGPVERRQITEAEREIRAAARPSPIARVPYQPPEEPAVSKPPADHSEGIPAGDGAPFVVLAEAALAANEAKEKAERATRVMAAIEAAGGDERAAAQALGMKLNAVVMVAKHARAAAGASA